MSRVRSHHDNPGNFDATPGWVAFLLRLLPWMRLAVRPPRPVRRWAPIHRLANMASLPCRPRASRRCRRASLAPAAALIVVVLGIVLAIASLYEFARFGVDAVVPDAFKTIPEFKAAMKEFRPVFEIAYIVSACLQLALSIAMLMGAMSMKQLKSRAFAMIAAIIAVIPCERRFACWGCPLAFGH